MSLLPLTIDNLVMLLRAQLGRPFVHQGREPQIGFDCVGLITYCLQQTTWQPRYPQMVARRDYRRLPLSDSLRQVVDGECVEISAEQVQVGDFLLMRWRLEAFARHIATVSEQQTNRISIIHTHWDAQRVGEHLLDGQWRSRIVSYHRLLDFATERQTFASR